MNTVKVKVLKDIPGYAAGQTVSVAVNTEGVPIMRFWRRRFSDAKTDNCLEVEYVTLIKASEIKMEPKASKPTSPKNQEKSK